MGTENDRKLKINYVPLRRRMRQTPLQGAFQEHKKALESLPYDSVRVIEVRLPSELRKCDALVIPGGESTSMRIIAQTSTLFEELHNFVHVRKKAVWGTCAGCILLSDEISNSPANGTVHSGVNFSNDKFIGGINVTTARNFFGRQVDSFEAPLKCHGSWSGRDFNAVCIRAPAIMNVSDTVEILATIETSNGESREVIAAAANDHILVTIFHPELTEDRWIHNYFVQRYVLRNGTVLKEAKQIRSN